MYSTDHAVTTIFTTIDFGIEGHIDSSRAEHWKAHRTFKFIALLDASFEAAQ